MPRPRSLLLPALTLVAVASGCSDSAAPYFDLAREFATAGLRSETRTIDLGTPGGRHHLVSGWARDEVDPRGHTYVSVTAAEARLRFELLGPRPLEIGLECRYRGGQGPHKRAVAVELNGHELQPIFVSKKLKSHTVGVEAEQTRAGENTLSLRTSDEAGGSGQPPPPRLSCHRVWLDHHSEDSEAIEATGDADRGLVFLPAGTEASYLFFLEAGSRWQADRVVLRGGDETRLEIELQTDDGGARLLATVPGSRHDLKIKTRTKERTAARLVLRALSTSSEPGAGVLLERPRLEAPQPAPVESDAAEPGPPPASRPNVLVYLIDTLRADRLGCYGYERPTSPNIDRFAAGATLFENAIGQSTWTKPSAASLHTGLWPTEHGAIGWRDRIPEAVETMAETLRSAGYRTAGFVANPNVLREFGFAQGFDLYRSKLRQPSDEMNEVAFAWLDEHGEEPFLLYLHAIDPHAPYRPPEPYRSQFAPTADQMPSWEPRWKWPDEALPYLSDLYDGEIAFNDDSFGKLVDRLREMGIYDDTLLILISDHGEAFKEHNQWRHGSRLYSETLNFPLIVKFPGQAQGLRVDRPVQHMDVLPTVLEVAGVAATEGLGGQSLAAFNGFAPSPPADSRRLFSHLDLDRGLQVGVVEGDWKLIRWQRGERVTTELYNWREDRGELHDLAAERPVLTAVLTARVLERLARTGAAEPAEQVELDADTEKALRALGYLQ